MLPRSIPEPPFAGDDGRADERLLAALAAYGSDPGRQPDVLAALHAVRVLVPVLASTSAREPGPAGLLVDASADVSLPLLEGEDGRRALPVFSGLDALSRWDAAARPVPVEGRRAALVAVAEAAAVLVVDVAGPVPCVLEEPDVQALGQGRAPVPAYDDDVLARHLARVLASDPRVVAAWISPSPGADARILVALADGRPDLLPEVARRLAADPDVAARAVRGLETALADAQPSGRLLLGRA